MTRSVVYRIQADVNGFTGPLRNAAASAKKLGDELTRNDKAGRQWREGLVSAGNAAGKVGLVAAVGLGAAVKKAADFDQSMSSVRAATHETAANMGLLREAAIKAGADTAFSATEAAAGIENLAKAGVSTKDVLAGGLSGALDLAAAGSLDVGQAAEIAATALTQFKLKGADVPHVADLLAAGAGKAQGEVSDLGMALNQAGLVAAQMGLSIEETTGSLAAFASAGLLGSDAGTSLKTMLLRLANPSAESAKTMKRLGITAYDANGNLVEMADLAGQLQKAFKGKSQSERDAALSTIFGSDAIRAANVLYSEGQKGIEGWTNKVNDQGYAAETAATKLDNLKGDLEQLSGAFETALIGTGSGSQGPLRTLTQELTDAVNAYNDLGDGAKQATAGSLAFVAVAGGSLFVTSKMVTGLAGARTAMVSLGLASEATATKAMLTKGALLGLGAGAIALGHLGDEATDAGRAMEALGNAGGGALIGFAIAGPVGAAVGALGGLVAASGSATEATKAGREANKSYAASFDEVTGAATRRAEAIARENLGTTNAVEAGRLLGISEKTLTDAILGRRKAQRELNDALTVGNIMLQRGTIPHLESGADAYNALSQSMYGVRGFSQGLVQDFRQQAKVAKNSAAEVAENRKVLESLPHRVVTTLRTEGVPKSRAEAIDLAHKLDLTKGERRAFLRAIGFDAAAEKARATGRAIDDLDGKTATTYVNQVFTTKGRRQNELFGGQGNLGMLIAADGIRHYALGDIANHHQPELAGPGPTRIWREPETMGEAYIPLANDYRRPRAQAIASETVRLLGGTAHFAQGGMSAQRYASTTSIPTTVNLSGARITAHFPGIGQIEGVVRSIAKSEVADYADRQDKRAQVGRFE